MRLVIEWSGGTKELGVAELGGGGEPVAVGDLLPDDSEASYVTFESRVGDYRASIPLEVVRAQGVLVFDRDANTWRLQVVDGATLCWNVKDVGRIRLTASKEPDSVPENPPH